MHMESGCYKPSCYANMCFLFFFHLSSLTSAEGLLVLQLGDKLALVGTGEQPEPDLGHLLDSARDDVLTFTRVCALLDPSCYLSKSILGLGTIVKDSEAYCQLVIE